jgi:two-component system, response regulator, stage 0 sporulation protein F
MPTVLVIDDDNNVRRALDVLLRSHHFGVFLAADGFTGINLISATLFDAVLVDIFMPGLDGLATIRQIRAAHATVPIIAMSGRNFTNVSLGKPDFLGMAVKLGADAALQKPFSSKELLRTIDELIGTPRSLKPSEDQDCQPWQRTSSALVSPKLGSSADVR